MLLVAYDLPPSRLQKGRWGVGGNMEQGEEGQHGPEEEQKEGERLMGWSGRQLPPDAACCWLPRMTSLHTGSKKAVHG